MSAHRYRAGHLQYPRGGGAADGQAGGGRGHPCPLGSHRRAPVFSGIIGRVVMTIAIGLFGIAYVVGSKIMKVEV